MNGSKNCGRTGDRTSSFFHPSLRGIRLNWREVIAAGGDGTAHEVANGILLAGRPEVEFAVLPIGSANDFAYSLARHNELHPAKVHTIDVGRIREPGGKQAFFICCLGLGFNGAVTLESRKIERLQGIFLYGLAALRALMYHFRRPTMEIQIDSQPVLKVPTLMFSVLIGQREGGFVFAPQARLDDGLFDYVHARDLSRFGVLCFLPRLALFGPPKHHPKLTIGQCRSVRIKSPDPLTVHVDGEFFARPEDNIHEVEIEIIPAALKVRAEVSLEMVQP